MVAENLMKEFTLQISHKDNTSHPRTKEYNLKLMGSKTVGEVKLNFIFHTNTEDHRHP